MTSVASGFRFEEITTTMQALFSVDVLGKSSGPRRQFVDMALRNSVT